MKNTSKQWRPEHDKLLPYVSAKRQEKIHRCRFDAEKVTSLYAALLTRLGITRMLGCNNSDLLFEYEDHHKPSLAPSSHPKADFLDFNFSHTQGAVLVGIISHNRIGVDIEKISTPPFDVMNLVFHPSEIDYVHSFSDSDKEKAFFSIWTKKEAYTKCLGTGLVRDLKSINTLADPIASSLDTWIEEDYVCSICIISY